MTVPDFNKNYFELFNLPLEFGVDKGLLSERYRRLQQDMHPDPFATASTPHQPLPVK